LLDVVNEKNNPFLKIISNIDIFLSGKLILEKRIVQNKNFILG